MYSILTGGGSGRGRKKGFTLRFEAVLSHLGAFMKWGLVLDQMLSGSGGNFNDLF